MFRTATAQDTKSKRELRKIGQRLRDLIQQDDSASLTEALNIIDAHQNDSDVINAKKFSQSTLLMLACQLGKKKIVKKLLATKCIDVNITGHAKANALEAALTAKQFKIALLLASDMRVNINATGAGGIHPAFRALSSDSGCPFEVAKLIISRPDMDLTAVYVIKDKRYFSSQTILHSLIEVLARTGHEDVLALIKQVLAVGTIDINAFHVKDIKTRLETFKTTALMFAAQNRMPALVSLLLSAGADTELRNEKGLRAADIVKGSEIYGMIKEHKHRRVLEQSSLSMFGGKNNMPEAQPAAPEYQEPPQPSAPSAEDVNVDTSSNKPVLKK